MAAKIGKYELRRFAALSQQDPCFSVLLDDKKTWLRPYCAVAAVDNRIAENFAELALKHIYESCPKTKNLDGLILTLRQLNESVASYRMKALCAKEPSWRILTASGAWLCPFCAEPTSVNMVDGAGVKLVCVDINPAVVTKLADRGSLESVGIVTDVGLFLSRLVQQLAKFSS